MTINIHSIYDVHRLMGRCLNCVGNLTYSSRKTQQTFCQIKVLDYCKLLILNYHERSLGIIQASIEHLNWFSLRFELLIHVALDF